MKWIDPDDGKEVLDNIALCTKGKLAYIMEDYLESHTTKPKQEFVKTRIPVNTVFLTKLNITL